MGIFYNGIMGFVVGDALGVPAEFLQRDSFHITDMIGGGRHNQPAGTWSDDSSMILATLYSLLICKRIDKKDIMDKFALWIEHQYFTPYGTVFDVGQTTMRSIINYINGVPWFECGGTKITDNGNGALMRVLPIAIYLANNEEISHKKRVICDVCALTHNHVISHIACTFYSFLVRNLISGMEKKEAFSGAWDESRLLFHKRKEWELYENLLEIPKRQRNDIKSSGYVVDTLKAAIWCFFNTENYSDCVLTAVNLGGDTDTIAAISGGLAGLIYGVGGDTGVPERWIEKISRKDFIERLCRLMEQSGVQN